LFLISRACFLLDGRAPYLLCPRPLCFDGRLCLLKLAGWYVLALACEASAASSCFVLPPVPEREALAPKERSDQGAQRAKREITEFDMLCYENSPAMGGLGGNIYTRAIFGITLYCDTKYRQKYR